MPAAPSDPSGSSDPSGPSRSPEVPELPVVFRPRRTRVVLLTVGAVLVVVFAVLAGLMPGSGRGGWGLGDRLTFVGSGLLIFAVLALLTRPKIIADREGLTVVNLTVKRRLEWPELIRVNLKPGDPWVYLDLSDGTSMAAMGIQPGAGKQQAVHQARQLRALAETLGTDPTGH